MPYGKQTRRQAADTKEWPVYAAEADREREQVENVFGLGGGELEDESFAGYAYNYEGAPEYAANEIEELDYQYHTVIVSGGGYLPSPYDKLEEDGVRWDLVEYFMNSGESDCWICGAGGNGVDWWADEFEQQHGHAPGPDDRCGLCETEMEDMPGVVYIGEGYEAVYRTHNRNIWPEDYEDEPRGAALAARKRQAAGRHHPGLRRMKKEMKGGFNLSDMVEFILPGTDAAVHGKIVDFDRGDGEALAVISVKLIQDPSGEWVPYHDRDDWVSVPVSELSRATKPLRERQRSMAAKTKTAAADGDCDSPYQEEAVEAVRQSDPANIPDYGYHGDLPRGETWAGTFSVNRDSDLLGQSNFEVILADLESKFPDDVMVERAGHWAVGWVDEIMVRMLDDNGCVTPAGEAALEWNDTLSDYPVADESHWSEKQYEAAQQWFGDQVGSIVRNSDELADDADDHIDDIIDVLIRNDGGAWDYILEDPEQHSIEDEYVEEVLDAARQLGLDWLSRNQKTVVPFIKQLIRETEMDADQIADTVADEFEVDPDAVLDIVEQLLNAPDPRQQELLR